MLLKADGEQTLHDWRESLGDERVDAAVLLITRMEELIGSDEMNQAVFDRIAEEAFDDSYRSQLLTDKVIIAQIVEKTWMLGEAFLIWRRKSEYFTSGNRNAYPYVPLQTLLSEQGMDRPQEFQ